MQRELNAYTVVSVLVTASFLFIFIFLPLSYLASKTSIESIYDAIFGKYSWIFIDSLLFSFKQAIISATISIVAGGFVAYASLRVSRRLSEALRILSFVAFMMPSTVVATSFYATYGIRGIPLGKGFWGIISAHVFYNAPLAYIYVYSALSTMSRELVESLEFYAMRNKLKYYYTLLRMILPAVVSSWTLAFVYCFTSFAIPLTLGGPKYWTLEVYIYYTTRILNNYGLGAFMALLQVLIVGTVLFLIRKYERAAPSGAAELRRDFRFIWAPILYLIYELLPLLSLVFHAFYDPFSRSFTLRALSILSDPIVLRAGLNTLYFALLATLISLIIGTIASMNIHSMRISYSSLLTSSVVLGLGLYALYSDRIPTWILIPIAHALVALPLASTNLYVGRSRIPQEINEMCRLYNVRGVRYYLDVYIPLVFESFLTAIMFSIVVSIGEFGATYMLYQRSYETLSVLVYRLTSARRLLEASLISTLIVLLSSLLSLGILKVRRGDYRIEV